MENTNFLSVKYDFWVFKVGRSDFGDLYEDLYIAFFCLRAVERVTLLRFLFGMHPY